MALHRARTPRLPVAGKSFPGRSSGRRGPIVQPSSTELRNVQVVLRGLLRRDAITQTALAETIGASVNGISRLLTGRPYAGQPFRVRETILTKIALLARDKSTAADLLSGALASLFPTQAEAHPGEKRIRLRRWNVEASSPTGPHRGRLRLIGRAFGHPTHAPGDEIMTAPVLAISGRRAEAASGLVFELEGAPDPAFTQLLRQNAIPYNQHAPIDDRALLPILEARLASRAATPAEAQASG